MGIKKSHDHNRKFKNLSTSNLHCLVSYYCDGAFFLTQERHEIRTKKSAVIGIGGWRLQNRYVFDRGFDRWNYIEPFLALKRHFIIHQRGDRIVVLDNGVRIILSDFVEHLFAQSRDWLVYKKLYLPDSRRPLYVVAYRTAGHERPVILLTDVVAEDYEMACGIRRRFMRRWDCESSIQFLKSKIGLERFAVRSYRSMQRLIFLAALAMGFLSYLQSSCKDIRRHTSDQLRYCREPKGFWFY